jgi:hypothetical protein
MSSVIDPFIINHLNNRRDVNNEKNEVLLVYLNFLVDPERL